jgi:hypothetical protein
LIASIPASADRFEFARSSLLHVRKQNSWPEFSLVLLIEVPAPPIPRVPLFFPGGPITLLVWTVKLPISVAIPIQIVPGSREQQFLVDASQHRRGHAKRVQ